MRAKTLLAVLFLISLGLVALAFLRAVPQPDVVAQKAAAAETHEVLAAAAPLQPGTLLRARDVTWKLVAGAPDPRQIARPPLGARMLKPELDEQASGEARGAALRVAIADGAPILRSDIIKPGDRDFLQFVLSPGARAIVIPLPPGSENTGLLNPGDRVDVILTQTFAGDTPLTRRVVSETVAESLRVLAIDPLGKGPRSLTLEVTPDQAEHVNVAKELGKLSLILRGGGAPVAGTASLPGQASGVRPAWAGDVSPALLGAAAPAVSPPAARPSIEVIRGNQSKSVKAE